MLELHEARHEGAAGEAVGPMQPPDPGAQHVPQELEPLAVHALLHVHAEEGHELLAGRRGEAEALRHVRGVRPVQALPDLHARGGSPVQVVVQLRGEVVVHEEQVAHLLGVGLPVQAREARLAQPAQPRCVVFRQGDRHAGTVGHGQRHCGRAHGVEVQVRDPADGLLGLVVLLAQLGVVGLSEGLEDAAQPAHDGGPHVPVGLLVGDEVNGCLAGRVPQHGVPGGPTQRGWGRTAPGRSPGSSPSRPPGRRCGGSSRGTLGRSPTP